jgi:hypothetical protein
MYNLTNNQVNANKGKLSLHLNFIYDIICVIKLYNYTCTYSREG